MHACTRSTHMYTHITHAHSTHGSICTHRSHAHTTHMCKLTPHTHTHTHVHTVHMWRLRHTHGYMIHIWKHICMHRSQYTCVQTHTCTQYTHVEAKTHMDTAHTCTQYTRGNTCMHRSHMYTRASTHTYTDTDTQRGTFLQATQKISDPGQVGGFLEIP